MTITHKGFTVELTEQDLGVWMSALRIAVRKRQVRSVPWDSCCYLKQHCELARLTGIGLGDQADLEEFARENRSGDV